MKAVVFYESGRRPVGTLRVNTSCIARKNLITMSPVTAGPGGSHLAA
jgi:hypothetical protein